MQKFHVNQETGLAAKCSANVSKCPYIHSDTLEGAQQAFEEAMSALTLPASVSVKDLRKMPSEALRKMPLKALDSNQLAQTLRHEATRLGMESDVVDSAIDLATILHAHQVRSNRGNFSKSPYIEHPLRNSLRLIRLGVSDQDVIVASILHDTVEDGARIFVKRFYNEKQHEEDARESLKSHIQKAYGKNVAELVEAVTNDYIADSDSTKMSLAEKHKVYLEHVRKNIQNNPGAFLVKVSDFIDNATGLYHNDTPERRSKTRNQALKYLPVVEVFKQTLENDNIPLSEEAKTEIRDKMSHTTERLLKILQR